MANPKKSGLSDNSIGAIAYCTPIIAFFFLAIRRYNKRPYVRFHAWQSLLFNVFAICIGYILAYLLPYLKFLGTRVLTTLVIVVSLTAFLLWLWCVVGALNGKCVKLPLIGEWADEQAYR
jgi:uncharacterized membrane protein